MRESFNIPATRTWRDIPQPVVPRAMSREGRLRLVLAGLRATALLAIAGLVGWGGWVVMATLQENSKVMPEVAKATPMKPPVLNTDGVLDDAWLVETLALPPQASLMELDLPALRTRLLRNDQVINATLTRQFPDRLVVQISERSPVARVMTEWQGTRQRFLVARDGVIYAGVNYDRDLLRTLPWLDGIEIKAEEGRFRPLEGMGEVAELLATARLQAEHLYENWSVVSLTRFNLDRKIEVRAKDKRYVVFFTTRDDYFRQLAKLNFICVENQVPPGMQAVVDLSLGRDVPVKYAAIAPEPPSELDVMRPTPAPRRDPRVDHAAAMVAPNSLFLLSHPQPNNSHREL